MKRKWRYVPANLRFLAGKFPKTTLVIFAFGLLAGIAVFAAVMDVEVAWLRRGLP